MNVRDTHKDTENVSSPQDMNDQGSTKIEKLLESIVQSNTNIQSQLSKMGSFGPRRNQYGQRRNDQPRANQGNGNSGRPTGCFRCGLPDHFVRDCPYPVVTGQLQLSTHQIPMQPASMTGQSDSVRITPTKQPEN